MLELCTVLEDGLTRGHVYDMGSVWEKYKKNSDTYESEIPQKYMSRRQSFIEDIQK